MFWLPSSFQLFTLNNKDSLLGQVCEEMQLLDFSLTNWLVSEWVACVDTQSIISKTRNLCNHHDGKKYCGSWPHTIFRFYHIFVQFLKAWYPPFQYIFQLLQRTIPAPPCEQNSMSNILLHFSNMVKWICQSLWLKVLLPTWLRYFMKILEIWYPLFSAMYHKPGSSGISLRIFHIFGSISHKYFDKPTIKYLKQKVVPIWNLIW